MWKLLWCVVPLILAVIWGSPVRQKRYPVIPGVCIDNYTFYEDYYWYENYTCGAMCLVDLDCLDHEFCCHNDEECARILRDYYYTVDLTRYNPGECPKDIDDMWFYDCKTVCRQYNETIDCKYYEKCCYTGECYQCVGAITPCDIAGCYSFHQSDYLRINERQCVCHGDGDVECTNNKCDAQNKINDIEVVIDDGVAGEEFNDLIYPEDIIDAAVEALDEEMTDYDVIGDINNMEDEVKLAGKE